MPNVQENLVTWDETCEWPGDGDNWSAAWGTSSAQWNFTILPRIHEFLPTGTILEIAPGHGRWTQFLKDLCAKLILVDLSPTCIDACRRRFGSDHNILYYTNDGTSLDMIPDQSLDFVFSFDSLVHVEAEAMKPYLDQISRKLKEGGGGFIHHSNLGQHPNLVRLIKWSQRLGLYNRLAVLRNQEHWRASSMTAELFRIFSAASGLWCQRQELVNWIGTPFLIDCLSTFRKGVRNPEQCIVVGNRDFASEAKHVCRLSKIYIYDRP
jgi:2-polyprenyl-3-methyl-5-hydroxy-6-metoxy-1,4-benzoquinol methylase